MNYGRRSISKPAIGIALLAAGAIGAALTVPAQPAAGQASRAADAQAPRQTGFVRFTETRPGRPSEVILEVDYVNPDDPDGKPPSVRTTEVIFAPGTIIDTSIPDRCTASDVELRALGEAACLPGSRVGHGTIDADTGVPGPTRRLETDVTLLNNANELIFVSTIRGTPARVIARSPIEGRRVTNTVPDLPGAPPDGGALDKQRLIRDRIAAPSNPRRGYMTTPSTCPKRGYWINLAVFTYEDGVRQEALTRSPCKRPTPRRQRRTSKSTPPKSSSSATVASAQKARTRTP